MRDDLFFHNVQFIGSAFVRDDYRDLDTLKAQCVHKKCMFIFVNPSKDIQKYLSTLEENPDWKTIELQIEEDFDAFMNEELREHLNSLLERARNNKIYRVYVNALAFRECIPVHFKP